MAKGALGRRWQQQRIDIAEGILNSLRHCGDLFPSRRNLVGGCVSAIAEHCAQRLTYCAGLVDQIGQFDGAFRFYDQQSRPA